MPKKITAENASKQSYESFTNRIRGNNLRFERLKLADVKFESELSFERT